ncbi:hypothetical protein GTP45_27410 [Pseudoduganella sp. FT55W]|uniref:Toprim domain-containing protein n=1 Tax=Duganella rivi TaxID=2666083 RepID=A0A7X4KEQ6_9BURK|nr:toprim domain-containing protein [Duganella rivi]MYM70510.1 hypothetical protein [Duganella rivi]
MADINKLKRLIDLHDLADRLGLKRGPGGEKALYHSPQHPDKSPSLSIFVDHPKNGTGWKDHSQEGVGGSCIDLVMLKFGMSASEAMKWLHESYAIPFDKPEQPQEQRPKSTLDFIAEKCVNGREKAREYLKGRGISDAAIDAGMKAKTIGYNDWTSTAISEGNVGFGGPAAAFLVRDPDTLQVVGVDMRFFDPERNGKVKTQSHGTKDGIGWTVDWRKLQRAERVYIVESSINALSIDSCNIPKAASFAIRGIGNAELIDFAFLKGKQVIICMDNDEPFPDGHHQAGRRPGPEAAWALYDRLTAMNISAVIVDQTEWKNSDGENINDANDVLDELGVDALRKFLDVFEPWLIAGQVGDATRKGKPRVYLPAHDFAQYWKFRTRLDFTSYIGRMTKNDETGEETPVLQDLAGFRIASLSRVSVASATATMTGDKDQSPSVYFAVTVQTPRHGAQLTRKVLLDDQLHNTQQWSKFGPIWKPAEFSRMVNILERTAHIGARNAANYVGLAWRDGELIVNEGPDCYFTEGEKQCPYYNLTFPSGPVQDAAKVIRAYQTTFTNNAASTALVWALGGHMKTLLGFWPHMTLQADKSSGKSTLIKRLERTINFTMFSGQSLQTEFRLLTSISHTSHPVGWEELSARRQDVIDKAVGLLQENYQYTVTKRGAEMTEYLLSAPVMLAGEDVPVRSLLGKIVRTTLTGKKGPLMPEDLPRFPVRQWLQFLAGLNKMDVVAKYAELRDHCLAKSRAGGSDEGAKRMAGNYAAVMLAWRYLAEFAGMDYREGDFGQDLLKEMNSHLSESSADRSPWVWIMETVLSEIDAGSFKHPYKFDNIDGSDVLLIRTGHIMDHIAHSSHLRDKWNSLPVKTPAVFKRQLEQAEVIVGGEVERTILTRRVGHLTALSLEVLGKFGLSVSIRKD